MVCVMFVNVESILNQQEGALLCLRLSLQVQGNEVITMALVHNAGKLKFGAEKKGEKGKKRF
jgi:hypothetical protein